MQKQKYSKLDQILNYREKILSKQNIQLPDPFHVYQLLQALSKILSQSFLQLQRFPPHVYMQHEVPHS